MFEVVLVPMYFLIIGWGYDDRRYAAMKFFIYTFAGSAFLFVAMSPSSCSRRRTITGTNRSTGSRWPGWRAACPTPIRS